VDAGQLILTVKTDCEGAEVLVKRTISESVIPVRSFQPFEFEPLDLPPDQGLCLELSSTASTRDNNLTVGTSLGDANPDGEASYTVPDRDIASSEVNTTETAAYRLYLPLIQRSPTAFPDRKFDIGYRLHYAAAPINAFDALLIQLGAHKPGIFGTRWLYVALCGAYLTLLGLFFLIIWRLPETINRN
jgi:hypothetical protein